MNKVILFSSIFTLTILLSFSVDSAFAHPHIGSIQINDHLHEPQTEIIPLNGMIGLEKSTVEKDGSYEYRFRVLNSDSESTTKIFEGDYSVKIFKVVYLNQNNLV